MHSMEENDNHNESEAGAAPPSEAAPDVAATGKARGHGLLFGVLMGALVGAGLATIFTPVSGEQARVLTAEKAPELWRRREEMARGVAGGARSRFGEALEAAREATQESQQEARRRYEQMTGRRSGPPLP
jgi:gas vesicle protein